MPLTQPPDHGIFLLAFVPIAHRGKEQTSTHRPSGQTRLPPSGGNQTQEQGLERAGLALSLASCDFPPPVPFPL